MSGYIDLLKATRAEIVHLLKRQGGMSVDALATELAISKVAVRRHLDQLEEQGFVCHCAERCDRGRPRYVYSLTNEGDGLFPDNSSEFACDLLDQVERSFGIGSVERLLGQQATSLIDELKQELVGLEFDDRVKAIAKWFNERGYVTDVERLADGTYRVVEHNCPIREVAERFPRVCAEELRVYSEVVGASVEKASCCIATGGPACEYRIVPQQIGGRRLPVVSVAEGEL
jgi:predicted ArsR family transcriptional regulator